VRPPAKVTKRRCPPLCAAQDVPAGARPAPLPAFVEPSRALLAETPPSGPPWGHDADAKGLSKGSSTLPAKAVVTVGGINPKFEIDGDIELA
jgi:hypothetical protein